MSAEGPRAYPVVFDTDSGLQYSFQSGYINIPTPINSITALTGDVTATGPGSAVATIANGVVTTAKLANAAVTAAKLAAASVTPASISVTSTDDFTFPRDVTVIRNLIVDGSLNTNTIVNVGGGTINLQAFSGYVGILNSTRWIFGADLQSPGAVTIGAAVANDPSAILDIQSTTQGVLPPRMTTTQRNAISAPAEGLIVYDLTLHSLYEYNGSSWVSLKGAAAIAVLSTATVGGAAAEEVPVAGLLTTSTILAVTQQVAGGAALPLTGWTNVLNGSLNVTYSADMGPGARVLVYFIP
jgi:hypothetical protein